MRLLCALLLLPIATSGCDLLNPTGCVVTPAPGGFRVTITDSVSAAPLAFGAESFATEGDTHLLYLFPPAGGATELTVMLAQGSRSTTGSYLGAGSYTVAVNHPGYRLWFRNELILAPGPGPCHNLPLVELNARLVPLP